MSPPLRVTVDARLRSGEHGGVESMVVGLAEGLGELQPSDLDVRFVVLEGQGDWLLDRVPGVRALEVSAPSLPQVGLRKAKGALRRVAGRGRVTMPSRLVLPRDHAMSALAPDVVHYPFQHAALPKAPFIYQPHDLQHVHLPEFFTAGDIASREYFYPAMCRAASAVAVGTRWVKHDLVDHYGLSPDHVYVIALAPPAPPPATGSAVDLGLPDRYLLYPAVNWPHKNHERLIGALAVARSRGVPVELVLTGAVDDRYTDPRAMAAAAGVAEHVHVLGYVDSAALSAAYEGALGVVVPTLFESASFPVWEAFARGVPVACSNVTSLPDQVDGNALLFDPTDVDAMAQAMTTLWQDDAVRRQLAEGGRARVASFTWRRTAEGFAALYRRLGGRPLQPGDEQRLAAEDL